MSRGKSLVRFSIAIAVAMGAVLCSYAQQASLSADQIVSRNVTARGGLQAWRAVQTLSMSGKMQAGGNNRPALAPALLKPGAHVGRQPQAPAAKAPQVELPFQLELKRGHKLRMELQFAGQTAVQIYDGANGWKLRPYLNRTDYEPYTADEAKVAGDQSELDGYLVDYAAKGTTIETAGTEKVEGRDNYKLKLTLKNGYSFHVWIDAQTFLESKMEGTPRRLDGQNRPVEIYLREYRNVNGLQVPYVLETKVSTVNPGARMPTTSIERITIENVVVNPKLDDALFVKPQSQVAANTPHPATPSAKPAAQQQ